MSLKSEISSLVGFYGPMLGKELHEHLPDVELLKLWQACFTSNDLQLSQFSRYYLRYDIMRDDYIRLSPSILRDFLSFTLFSQDSQRDAILERLIRLSNRHREISRWKTHLARNVLADVFAELAIEDAQHVCAFIAGDLAYFLGHNEPREIEALGEMVRGSDLDIIIIHGGLTGEKVEQINQRMLMAKNYMIRNPNLRQELDFIVKSQDRMFGQFAYETIQQKIASKIAYESMFMAGSIRLYTEVMEELRRSGTQDRIDADFEKGLSDRAAATTQLLRTDPESLDKNTRSLFYFSQERIEFE